MREYVVRLAWKDDPTVISHVIVKANTIVGARLYARLTYTDQHVLGVERKQEEPLS